ncbi:hypothetical protein FGO68_gene10192 [Halteria grandinella]|uniref:Uncharacterized protein n=1 Tax=Halteria grandinella TaxID=5974 RepID=A0A8J8NME5_HALGN|nr:hypothetical protein FGO68_gene10192 [Halteria grandinella]
MPLPFINMQPKQKTSSSLRTYSSRQQNATDLIGSQEITKQGRYGTTVTMKIMSTQASSARSTSYTLEIPKERTSMALQVALCFFQLIPTCCTPSKESTTTLRKEPPQMTKSTLNSSQTSTMPNSSIKPAPTPKSQLNPSQQHQHAHFSGDPGLT